MLYTYSKCQTVWILIRPDFLSGFEPHWRYCIASLIWFLVCAISLFSCFFSFFCLWLRQNNAKQTEEIKKNAARKKRKNAWRRRNSEVWFSIVMLPHIIQLYVVPCSKIRKPVGLVVQKCALKCTWNDSVTLFVLLVFDGISTHISKGHKK